MTITEQYRATLAQIEEVQAVLQRMLGRADALADLMAAGMGDVSIPGAPDGRGHAFDTQGAREAASELAEP